ncbi:MAG: CD225/dispanin family protein [Muribaculaceae bacterium]|nr:CD225/dispanin family protein [Muribaculaceae bacterium]
MKYWIVINGERKGPMSIDELMKTAELTEETYVWNETMSQWEHAGNVEELKGIFSRNQDCFAEKEETHESEFEDTAELDAEDVKSTEEPTHKKAWYDYGEIPDMTQCPPTFLVLSIIMLLCCCQIFGIVAVIYASQVRSLYLSRQYEKAEKYSRNALIWSVVSLFAGMFYIPLYFLWTIYSQLF